MIVRRGGTDTISQEVEEAGCGLRTRLSTSVELLVLVVTIVYGTYVGFTAISVSWFCSSESISSMVDT